MIIKLLICDYHLKYVWYWSEDGEGKIGLESQLLRALLLSSVNWERSLSIGLL